MITEKILNQLEYFKVLEYIRRYAQTDNGKDNIDNLRPFNSIQQILINGEFVNEAKDILISNDLPPIDYIPDLNTVLSRSNIEGTILQQDAILEILRLAVISRKVNNFFKSLEKAHPLIDEVIDKLYIDRYIEYNINSVFTESGDIKDNASAKLGEIRKEIREKEHHLRKTVGKILKQYSSDAIVQDEYITQRDGRTVLPVKANYKRQVKGLIHSESATGQTVYIEPEETLELNNEIISLNFAEKREIERILKKLTKKIGEISYELKISLGIIAEVDTYFAIAKYSIEIMGAFPQFDETRKFEIIDGRHPILIKKLGREKTVPLNIKFSKNNLILITGPNAGGKTVVLKSAGLLSALVLSGIHVPVNPDSNFRFFDSILVDIGDQQSIEEDLSTFSSHLSNMKNIVDGVDENSLVLLDEIGTGTDPAEGSALATSVLITLQKSGAIVLATTHHGSLKLAANNLNGFENASMEFDNENLMPTYKFRQGTPGSSYAFEVAERIGLDKKILDLANQYLDPNKSKIENFLSDLEKKSADLKVKLDKLEIENTRLKGLTNLYEKKVEKLEKQKKEILEKTKNEAENYLSDVNKTVEAAIKNIKESNASKEVIKAEKQNIENLKQKTKKIVPKKIELKSTNDKPFANGDYVKLKDTTTYGTIEGVNEVKKTATLIAGVMKMQVKLVNIEHAKKQKQDNKPENNVYYATSQLDSYRLDIRGKRPEEIDFTLIKFLDNAYSSGVSKVEVLHGKGTGVLKKTVHDILKAHEHVTNYYFEKIEFGGDGVTIVELM